MSKYLHLLFILIAIHSAGQDTLFLSNGEKSAVKVVEIDQTMIRYKKYSNIDGPLYTISKQDVLKISYQNGEIDNFATPPEENNAGDNDLTLLHSLSKKGNKVFLESEVPNATIHATNYIKDWGFWIVTDRRADADFILKFVLIKSWPDYYGLAQFIDTKTNKIYYQTKKVSTEWNMDFNSKRGVIDKILRKRVQPLFES
jgi:hypothetical protein